ncbi:unnamed protein product [Plasmodium vivax]|uniref:(malaria parasite P. vivax) hypothetical protein n=1 Tax=Plasmodium vivax TaxID=5855 RepID=A0A8S4H2C0_PLAVI|nr:unnamed protein product [Plasmodium vivax]
MSTRWSPINRNIISRFQQLTGGGCTNKFVSFKSEIDRKIAKLDEKKPSDFCPKCFDLRTKIIDKDTEFKACSTGQSNQLTLIGIYDIKDFIDKCPTVPECIQKLSQRNKKPVVKKQGSERKCVKNSDCEPKVSSTASQTARQPPRSASKSPSTRITQEQKPQNLSGQHDNIEISNEGGPALQTKQNVRDPSKSSELEGEISKNSANDQSNTHVQAETKTRVSSPAAPEARETNTPLTDDSSQKSSDQHPESGNISQVSDLHKKTVQHNVPDGQGSGDSTPREQTPVGESIGNQAHNDKSVTTGISDGSPLVQIPPVNGEKVDEKSNLGTVSREGTENTAVEGVGTPSEDIHSSASSAITTTTMARNGDPLIDTPPDGKDAKHAIAKSKGDDNEVSGSKASDGEGSNRGDTHTEGNKNRAGVGGDTDNKNLCIGVTDNQSSNNGNRCSNGQGSELMDNNTNALGIFSNIFRVMQANKENVINTSIPYTPLWSFLTKRKRKKQSHMNEKLQRVLQQPSSGSETRSIPFSYSAFEYSSE